MTFDIDEFMSGTNAQRERMLREEGYVPKDHEIAQAVNELRDIAIKYHNTQQLRARISIVVHRLVKRK